VCSSDLFTTRGTTALRAARERPAVPILCLTPNIDTARRLAMVFGVHAVQTADVRSLNEMTDKASRIAREDGIAVPGQRLVITAGMPFGTPGATNVLRIAWVEG
jgi:pyruvate kinase